ncbi:unnamed protein product [Larinioides sclopetarius]|uniref:Uncharacterized protein n=1 Tax=Larinioides sclopetarius TaxID=280406 RepID=A0AAV1ZV02_9ARAC
MRSALGAGAEGCPQVRLQLRLMYGSRDFNNRILNDPEVKQGHAELYLFGVAVAMSLSPNFFASKVEGHCQRKKPYSHKVNK